MSRVSAGRADILVRHSCLPVGETFQFPQRLVRVGNGALESAPNRQPGKAALRAFFDYHAGSQEMNHCLDG